MEKHWFVLYTSSRAEKKVYQRILEEGEEGFLPLYKSKRKWSDRIKVVELPLYSSYVFVKCTDYRLRGMLLLPGVMKPIYHDGKPAVVRENDIQTIKDFISITTKNSKITIGDFARIITGPLTEQIGIITKISDKSAYLSIPNLGTVLIDSEDILKLD
ncbi:MAG: transcription termination/antitermination NusG family protein [Bacteroidales bacterium]